MKTVTLSAPAGSNSIAAGKFVETESGSVTEWDGTGTIVGFAESAVNDSATLLEQGGSNVGVVKLGLINVEAAAATYNFGQAIEALDADTVQAFGSGQQIGTAAETKTVASGGKLKVYLNIA